MKETPKSKTPHPVEWIVGLASAAVVIGLITVVGLEALTSSGMSPQLSVSTLNSQPHDPNNQVRFEVHNWADSSAASVVVRGEAHRSDGLIETAETMFDYVPAQSSAAGALIFSQAVGDADVRIRAVGYSDP